MVTKKEHLHNLRRHDWSYMMSDDHSVYRRGCAEEAGFKITEHSNPELRGMYEDYRQWWWSLAKGSNVQGSGKGRSTGEPAPTFGVEED